MLKVTYEELISRFPRLPDVAKKLNNLKVNWAIFAGAEVWMLTKHREPTDLDIMLPDDSIDSLVDVLGGSSTQKENELFSSRVIELENIELVSNLKIRKDNAEYPFYFNDNVFEMIQIDTIGDMVIKLMPPEDTILIKLLLNREAGSGKHDLSDIAFLGKNVELDMIYLRKRAEELNISNNSIKFLLDILEER